jgi:putative restriction endonuclease
MDGFVMAVKRENWNRDELILAINLYCKIPFGRIHSKNPEIIELAKIIKRTPSAVAWKLVNFASLDPSLLRRGIKGAVNSSKLDKEIWLEFFNNWDKLAYESELFYERSFRSLRARNILETEMELVFKEGKDREALIKVRVNQNFFRATILASYKNKCAIIGISQNELLIASHIIPWGEDKINRLNPRNGICLNVLHDKAFDTGLITITTDYKFKTSKTLTKEFSELFVAHTFQRYEDKTINLPSRFMPDPKFLQFHHDKIFRDSIPT